MIAKGREFRGPNIQDALFFYQGLNLSERTALIPSKSASETTCSTAHSEKQVRWWIKTYFGGRRKLLESYLQNFGITLAELFLIVDSSELSSLLPTRDTLWDNPEGDELQLMRILNKSKQFLGFEFLCRSLLINAVEEVHKCLRRANSSLCIDTEAILYGFDVYLRQRLANILMPTFILEANLARLQLPAGDSSPEGRFRSFAESFRDPDVQDGFWKKYPVLRRFVTEVSHNVIRNCTETISQIAEDFHKLQAEFSLDASNTLSGIRWGAGDTHCGGHVVAILNFGKKKLVYKPRSVKAEKLYNDFVRWYSSVAGDDPVPLAYSVLDCEAYGYVGYIEDKNGVTSADIPAFYDKLGQLVAIAWLLGITDLHFENVIASGADPYLVDLEAMLDRPLAHFKKKSFLNLYYQSYSDLLFRTGLLPLRKRGDFGVYDISAIGAQGDQPTPSNVLSFENVGRDDAKIVFKQGIMGQQRNVPILEGHTCKPGDYIDEIVAGFERAVDIFDRYKSDLIGTQSPLSAANEIPVRWITRDTRDYASLLRKMTHPGIVGDALDCEMLIGGDLSRVIKVAPQLVRVIPSEVKDLWLGDVPYFWTKGGSLDLFDSRNNVYEGYFANDGISCLHERIGNISTFKKAQIEALRLALESTKPKPTTILWKEKTSKKVQNVPSDEELVEYALSIGKDIVEKAHFIEGIPFWSGLNSIDEQDFGASVLSSGLYGGTAGIGMFLSYLSKVTEDKKVADAALGCHEAIRMALKQKIETHPCGAFSGYAGFIYSDMHMSDVLGQKIATENKAIFNNLKTLIKNDENYDLISGAAGALLVSLRYHSYTGSSEALSAAGEAARCLLKGAEYHEAKGYVTWHTLKSETNRVGGLSHGASGIAWALSEWAKHTCDDKWKELARKAFVFEESLFDESLGTWKDARDGSPTCFWCYGAPGIGLAIHHMRSLLGDRMADELIQKAQNATWKYGMGNNYGLCHGSLGNSELFLSTGKLEDANLVVSNVVQDFKKRGMWLCGYPGQAKAPGFMCGLSGIGYGLLRHAFPSEIPNVLALEGPRIFGK